MNLFIIDDEYLQRQSMKSIVEHSHISFDFIGTYGNAKEAIRDMESHAPSIVLSDILMPEMDGIELAHYVHERYPLALVLLISGYTRFEYAREGIDAHVFDYILKPIDRDTIIASIDRAYVEYRKKMDGQAHMKAIESYFSNHFSSLRAQYFSLLLTETLPTRIESLAEQANLFSLDYDCIRLVAFSLDKENATIAEISYDMNLLREHIEAHTQYVSYLYGNLLYVLYPVQPDRSESILEWIRCIRNDVFTESTLHIGVSAEFHSIANLQIMRQQAESCLENPDGESSDAAAFFEDRFTDDSNIISLNLALSSLLKAIRIGRISETDEYLKTLISALHKVPKEQQPSANEMILSKVRFEINQPGLASMVNHSLTDIDSLKTYIVDIGNAIIEKNTSIQRYIAAESLKYIEDHYAEQIGLNDLASFLHRSPGYISTVFKQYIGTNFVQKLAQIRIEKAKQLLADSTFMVNDIALSVGYTNVRTFYRAFNEQVGMSATNYRKIVLAFKTETAPDFV